MRGKVRNTPRRRRARAAFPTFELATHRVEVIAVLHLMRQPESCVWRPLAHSHHTGVRENGRAF
jgi:hypothetical protein